MTRHGAKMLTSLPLVIVLAACGGGNSRRHSPFVPPSPASDAPSASTATTSSAPNSGPQAPQALVTDETQNRLLLVDLPSGRIVKRVALPSDPEDIATAGNGGVVIVVSSGAGVVTALVRDTLRPIRTFRGFDEPHIAAISPDGQYAYITDDVRGTLTVIRLSDMRVTSTVHVGSGAHHLSFSPNQQRVWIGLGESASQITILDTTNSAHPRVISRLRPGFPAHDVSFSPDGREVLVTSSAGRDVTAFDPKSHHVLYRVPVGRSPQHVAFAGHYAYLTSGYGSTIEKVSVRTGRVITRARAPYGSFELAAADGYVTTASLLRGTLAIYNPDLKRVRVVKVAPATREVAISRP